MKQHIRGLLVLVIVLCLVVGLLPATVLATDTKSEKLFVSQQLMLGDNLTMNFGLSIDAGNIRKTKINVTLGENETSYAVSDLPLSMDGTYIVSVDVAAAQMTETIRLEVVTDGVPVAERNYTVRDYAEAVLNADYNAETKELVEAMLNYGAQAQIYFGYKTDNLANVDYACDLDEVKIPITDMTPSISGSVSGVSLYGASMIYTGKMTLRYYFTAVSGVEGYTFTANGNTYTAQKKDNLYYVDITGINPQSMDEVVEVSVSNGTDNLTVGYSPLHYIVRMYQKENEALKPLLKAMYAYYKMAQKYVSCGGERVAAFYTAGDTVAEAISAFEVAYPGHKVTSKSMAYGENIVTVAFGDVTYDMAFYWEKASSMQSISGIVSDASKLNQSTYSKIGTITKRTTFVPNDTINITGTADASGFIYFYWKTNQKAICNDFTLGMDMRLYVQNYGGMAEWSYDSVSYGPNVPFTTGSMTVVDLLDCYSQDMCGYWMLHNQPFGTSGEGMIGLGVCGPNGMSTTVGPNESITEDGTQFWVIGLRIFVGANKAYDLDLCLAGSGAKAFIPSYAVAAESAEAAIAAFEKENPGYDITSEKVEMGVNTVSVTVDGNTRDMILYWEKAGAMQSVSGIVADVGELTGSTYSTINKITSTTTFSKNDSVKITGTADEKGFIYFYWKTNQMAVCNNNLIDMDLRLYVQNNGNIAEWQYDTDSGNARVPFVKGTLTGLDLCTYFQYGMCGYWMLNNQAFNATGSGMYGLGVGNNDGIVSTAAPNESINEDGEQFWIIGFRIYVGANQSYDLDICLAGSGEQVNYETCAKYAVTADSASEAITAFETAYPGHDILDTSLNNGVNTVTVKTFATTYSMTFTWVKITDYYVTADSAKEALEIFEATHPGYKINDESINIGKNTVRVSVGDITYNQVLYWEKVSSLQSISDVITDAETLTQSTYSEVGTITSNSIFARNDSINITGTADSSGFVYFYWKTNQVAICDNFEPVVDMRLYVQNNGGLAEWQHDTATGAVARIPFVSGEMTVVDMRSAFQANMCGYWMLANQQFSTTGNGMPGLGVGNSNGIVTTSGPNESITEDGAQYWIIGFCIYVGENQAYDLDLCLAGSGTKYLIPSYTVTAETSEAAIDAFEKTHLGYQIATETVNMGANAVSVTVDDNTYDMVLYWEKESSLQPVSGIVADAKTLSRSTYGKVGSITKKTTFVKDDTVSISGTAGKDGFIYFYWKTNQIAVCNNNLIDMDMRLYVKNNGGVAEWQHDTVSGSPRIKFASGSMTVVDLCSIFQSDMCGYWMLNNQPFKANGQNMRGLGVGDPDGIVNINANGWGANENITEDGTQFWIIGFRIYVGANQTYDMEICLAGSDEKVASNTVVPNDLFVANRGVISITPNVNFPDYSVDGNGVQILVKNEGTIRYTNVVDISEFNLNKELLSFQVLSNQEGLSNLSNVYLTLTDIYDPNNRIQIRFGSDWRYEGTVAVKYDTNWMFRNNYGQAPDYPQHSVITDPAQSGHGTWVDCNFDYNQYFANTSMAAYQGNGMPQFKIAMDYENGTIYTLTAKEMSLYHGYDTWTSVAEMLDSSVVGIGREWSYFTTGECYIDITIEVSNAGNGGIIISQIAGQDMSGDVVRDKTAPSIYIDVDEDYTTQLPDIPINYAYTLPEAKVLDVVDGELKATIEVFMSEQRVTNQVLVDGKFVGTQEGSYLIVYSAKDKAGNIASVSFNLQCVKEVPPMSISFASDTTSVYAGHYYVIPEITVTGGTGKINLDAVYYYNDQEIQLDDSRRIFLDKTGILRVECTVQDAVETPVVGSTVLEIAIVGEDAPVLIVSGVPHYVATGKQLVLPDFEAYNYSFGDDQDGYYATKKVLVNGTDVTKNLRYDVVEAAGSVLKVQYFASSNGKTVEKSFDVQVYKLSSIYDIVRYSNSITTNKGKQTSLSYSEFMGKGDYVLELANPVSATNLMFEVALSNNNLNYFDIVFKEFYGDRELFLRFTERDSTSSYMQVNGEGEAYVVDGSFTDSSKHFKFVLYESTGYLCNTVLLPLVKLDKWADMSNFDRVSKGALEFSIRVSGKEGADTSGIRLYRVSNQEFVTTSILSSFKDRTVPAVYLYDKMQTCDMDIGDTLHISAAEAYDVIDSKAEVLVSVIAPNGATLINKQSCKDSYEIGLDQYGDYSVIYYLTDSSNSQYSSTNAAVFTIHVKDRIAPVAEIIGTVPKLVRLGQRIQIPAISAYDNNSNVNITTIVVDTSETYHVVSNGAMYLPTRPGKYRIVYYVVDDSYNSTILECVVTVK